jgi:hypothetical protein
MLIFRAMTGLTVFLRVHPGHFYMRIVVNPARLLRPIMSLIGALDRCIGHAMMGFVAIRRFEFFDSGVRDLRAR